MAKQAKVFDVAAILDTDEAVAEYLTAAMESGNAGIIKESVGDIIRARVMTTMAEETGQSRGALSRAFGEGGNPTLDSLMAVLSVLRINPSANPPTPTKTGRRAPAKNKTAKRQRHQTAL